MFFIIFGFIYFPVAVIVGWLDFRKGTYRAEQQLTKEISPIWKEVFSKLERLEQQNKVLQESLDSLSPSE
jgi:hypothetical protein